VLLVELSIFWYIVGLRIISILKDLTLHCVVKSTIPAALKGKSVTSSLLSVLIITGPTFVSYAAPIIVVTLAHGFGCVMTMIESLFSTV